MSLLDKINEPNDIKKIKPEDMEALAVELRRFLLDHVSKTGGHLAANLGTVELTMALHLALDLPKDKIIWDVGHQAYVHKILTGRKIDFYHLREEGGISGFPKRHESKCDAFDTGHSSTSLSVANGMVCARELSGEDQKIVAVIGDGALSGGMAYEALNNIGKLKTNLTIVLNDNKMSIAENVGGIANYLGKLRTSSNYVGFKGRVENTLTRIPIVGDKLVRSLKKSKDSVKYLMIDGIFFEEMGITYIGPIDGHNIVQVEDALKTALSCEKPVLVHVITQKGKGYEFAEKNPEKYHGVSPFSLAKGYLTLNEKQKTYTSVFSETMISLGKKNAKLIAVTAAMPAGTGLSAFKKAYPRRFFDVGIAEEHAVTFAAGMAASGFHPVVAIYSTFLQRAYDQILHDVCISDLPVTFAIDRAGIVGKDGETHQGIFDLSYLSHIPGLVVMAPSCAAELVMMLEFAMEYEHPVAIRYPREAVDDKNERFPAKIELEKPEIVADGSDICIVSIGTTLNRALKLKSRLKKKGISVKVINARFTTFADETEFYHEVSNFKVVITIEENVKRGGFGEYVSGILSERGFEGNFMICALFDKFIEHGDQDKLRNKYGLNENMIYEDVLSLFNDFGGKNERKTGCSPDKKRTV